MIRAERETVVTMTDADDEVSIFTCRPVDLRALRARAGVREVGGGVYTDGTEWGKFVVPIGQFKIAQAVKRQLTDAQKAQRAAAAENNRGLRGDSGRFSPRPSSGTPSGSSLLETRGVREGAAA